MSWGGLRGDLVFYAKGLMVMEDRRRRIKTSGSMLAVVGLVLTKTIVLRRQTSDSRRRTSRLCSPGLVQMRANVCLHLPLTQSLRKILSLRQSVMRLQTVTPTTENLPYRSRLRFPLEN